MNIYTEENVFASDAIEHQMREYKKFVNRAVLGHSVDGLIKVQRRIIQVLSQSKPGTVKDVSDWASSVKPLHPHGESSIENAMTRLMQPFKYQMVLINIHGHGGGYKDAKASDKRYLKAAPSDFMRDVYLDTHKAALSFKFNESEDGSVEIEYLIPKIPMALCMGVEGIGVGFSTNCFPLDFNNVCELSLWYVEQVLKGEEAAIIGNKFPREVCHLLLPHFPIEGLVRNAEQLKDGFHKGTFDNRIAVEGSYRLTENEIIIHTIPYGTDFVTKSDQLDLIRKTRPKALSYFTEAIDDVQNIMDGIMRMRYKVTFKKKFSSWNFLREISSIFGLSSTTTAQSRWLIKNGGHGVLGPGQLLDIWYRERVRAINIKFSKEQDEYIMDLHRLKGILVLKDHSKEITDIIHGSMTTDEYAKILKERFNLSYFQAVEIGKVQLDKIKKTSRENILKDIEFVEGKLAEIRENMKDIPSFIKKEIKALQTKHGAHVVKRTIYPTYRGWIKTPLGDVQVQNLEEVKNRKNFNEASLLYLPHVCCKYKYMKNDLGKWESDHPVLFPRYHAKSEVQYLSEPATHTVILSTSEEGPVIRACQGLQALPKEEYKQLVLAGSRITTIERTCQVRVVNVADLPQRKSVQSSGNKTNIERIFGQAYDQMVIFHWSAGESNVVRASLILNGVGKLNVFNTKLETEFLIVPYVADQCIFTPSAEVFNRIKPLHIDIPDLTALFTEKHNIVLDLSKKTTKKGKDMPVKYFEL